MAGRGHTFNFNASVGTVNAPAGDMIVNHPGVGVDLVTRLDKVLRELEGLPALDAASRKAVADKLADVRDTASAGKGSKDTLVTGLETAAKTLEMATGAGEKGLKLAQKLYEIVTWVGSIAG